MAQGIKTRPTHYDDVQSIRTKDRSNVLQIQTHLLVVLVAKKRPVQYKLIFLAMIFRHMWQVRSVCEQLSQAP